MSKDVRIELIYYKTSTDISLEFGLHGDYPLRLLSVNAKNRTEFFHSLKRAVSRSEIIVIIGGYNKNDYLPLFLAKSIGRTTIESDNGDYGILSDGTVILPAGAIPLVTRGKFGGFIIESGPQTIFSLTDDREVRLAVIKEVIVRYITEHHKTFSTSIFIEPQTFDSNTDNIEFIDDSTTENEVSTQNVTVTDDTAPTEFTDISSSTIEETESQSEEPQQTVFLPSRNVPDADQTFILDNEDTANSNSFEIDVPSEPIVSSETSSKPTNHISESLDISPDEITTISKPAKARHETKLIRILCIILSILVVLGSVAFALIYPEFKDKDYYATMATLYSKYNDNPINTFQKIKQKDNRVFSWLEIESLNVSHPVLTISDASATSQHLNFLPNGITDDRGTLISTTSVAPNIADKNTIIYGNASVGGIFEKMFDENGINIGDIIKTSDDRYQSKWSVFSYFEILNDSYFNDAIKVVFQSNEEYSSHYNYITSLSINESDCIFTGNERVIILIGVFEGKKIAVFATLKAVRILSNNTAALNNNYTESTSSDINSSNSDVSDEPISSLEPDTHPEVEGEDFYGDSPDIILPPPPTVTESSDSYTESSKASSSIVSSKVDSSEVKSSQPESKEESSKDKESSIISSSLVSSSNVSSTYGSSSETSSSGTSSQTSSATPSKPSSPPVDPIYTWDKEFTIYDTADGTKYTAKAVDMVAMIIEDEMSPTIDPAEAVIAQAIVKYNWLLHNNGNKNALDPNPTPQARQYAEAAKGAVIMYGNTIAKTYCYAYSAGKTACYQDIWGGTAYPYLQSVDCPVDEELKDFITTSTYSADLISKIIKQSCGIDVSSMPKSEWLKPIKFDKNNLYCLKISIGGKEYNGRYLRETLLVKNNTNINPIRSTAYTITYNETDDTFTVSCKGYGHGVGLSQRGAKAYAKQGWTHEQIIAHFFPGTTIIKH